MPQDSKVSLRDRVVDFCVQVIREREEIPFEELLELVKQKFPEVRDFRTWAGLCIRKHIESRGIHVYHITVNGVKKTLYSTKKRVKKLKKKCMYCGKEIPHRGFNFCSEECYRELEKIANFFIPMPDFPSLERTVTQGRRLNQPE